LSEDGNNKYAKVEPDWSDPVKWVIFAISLVGVVPAALWLRQNPRHVPKVWMLFGFLPFAYNPHISLIDWAGWPGYVLGIQVTGIDLLALMMFMILPRAQRPAPFRKVMVLYLIAVVLSVFQAQVPMAAAFYPWQLLRVYFVYIVVRRASSDERIVDAILTGMTAALCFQVLVAGWQRVGGVVRAEGSFGDKNLLGLISEFAMFTPFALMLAGKRGWQTTVAPIAGAIIAVLTASRAAVGFGAIGLVLIFLMSSWRRWTPRKGRVLMAGIVAIAVLTPITVASFQKRFEQESIAGDERAIFNNVTAMMLADYPFGIGANNYVVVAISKGYSERAGVPWSSAVAIVHNIYWLTAAEAGYFGLIAFVLLWLQITIAGLRCSWKATRDPRGDMLLGLGVTLLVIGLHNAYEWVFLVYNVQYLFGITAGLVAGLAEQLGYWRTPQRVSRERSPIVPNSGIRRPV
jgi:O-antigen ligase